MTQTPDGRPRARGLGIVLPGEPGALNAITDVGGVEVGVTTLISGDGPLVVGTGPVRTGVTAILPRGRDGVGQPCAAGWYSLNGNGEMTGTTWIDEAGSFNLPVVLSNTHAVGARRDVGRLPQRHQRRPCPPRTRRGRTRRSRHWPGGRGVSRRRHGDEL